MAMFLVSILGARRRRDGDVISDARTTASSGLRACDQESIKESPERQCTCPRRIKLGLSWWGTGPVELPHPWADEIVRAADVVVTMGCGDACPLFPGKRYLDWELDDPAGKDIEEIRAIRDEIEGRVRALMAELGVEPIVR
jgi:hypothetical protein